VVALSVGEDVVHYVSHLLAKAASDLDEYWRKMARDKTDREKAEAAWRTAQAFDKLDRLSMWLSIAGVGSYALGTLAPWEDLSHLGLSRDAGTFLRRLGAGTALSGIVGSALAHNMAAMSRQRARDAIALARYARQRRTGANGQEDDSAWIDKMEQILKEPKYRRIYAF
jgi:hypothetical protein